MLNREKQQQQQQLLQKKTKRRNKAKETFSSNQCYYEKTNISHLDQKIKKQPPPTPSL